MAAALGTFSAVDLSKPMRIEGHTSNVEGPIYYRQFGEVTVAETTESGDTYNLPHQITNVKIILTQAVNGAAATFLAASSISATGRIVDWTQTTTAQLVGSSSLVLTGLSAIDDVYNDTYVDVRFANGDIQTVRIIDYAGATKVASLEAPLVQAIATTGTFFSIRGSLLTTTGIAVTPAFKYMVIGTFD